MWIEIGILATLGVLFAVFSYKEKAGQAVNEKEPGVIIRRDLSSNVSEMTKSLNREFKCGISCENIQLLTPDYNTKYTVNAKDYVGYQTLEAEECGDSEDKYGCDCDSVSLYKDMYGCKVLRLKQRIPCFDSGDREYDSAHLLYLFHNSGKTYALYCGEGYRVATLTLFSNVSVSNSRLRKYLKAEGFPV